MRALSVCLAEESRSDPPEAEPRDPAARASSAVWGGSRSPMVLPPGGSRRAGCAEERLLETVSSGACEMGSLALDCRFLVARSMDEGAARGQAAVLMGRVNREVKLQSLAL